MLSESDSLALGLAMLAMAAVLIFYGIYRAIVTLIEWMEK